MSAHEQTEEDRAAPFNEHFLNMEWEERTDLPMGVWRRLLIAERCQWANRHLFRLLSVDELSAQDAKDHNLIHEPISPATREAYWLAIEELSERMGEMFEQIRDGAYGPEVKS